MTPRFSGSVREIFANTAWLFSERVIQMGVALAITTLVARHLGPTDFGKLSFATAFVALFMMVSTLSLDGLIVREATRTPTEANSLLGSAFAIRLSAGLMSWFLATTIYLVTFSNTGNDYLVLLTIGSSLATQAFQVIDLWFQSQSKAYLGVAARLSSLLLSASLKITMLALGAPVLYFAIAQALESILTAASLIITYRTHPCTEKWIAKTEKALQLLRHGWPLALSGIGITIYMKIDQLAIGSILGEEALGIYSASTPIVQGLAVLPTVFSAIVFPKVVTLRQTNKADYLKCSAELVRYAALASLTLSSIVSIASPLIINVLYGQRYEAAAPVLSILVFNNIFVSIGVIQAIFGINESLQKVSLTATIIASACSVLLAVVFVPKYGLFGAAYSVITSNFLAVIVIPSVISKEYRMLYNNAFISLLKKKRA